MFSKFNRVNGEMEKEREVKYVQPNKKQYGEEGLVFSKPVSP